MKLIGEKQIPGSLKAQVSKNVYLVQWFSASLLHLPEESVAMHTAANAFFCPKLWSDLTFVLLTP